MARALASLKRADVVDLGRSAGGRPLTAVRYGAFEPIDRCAHHSAAWSAGDPEAFLGRRDKGVVLHSCRSGPFFIRGMGFAP